MSYFDGVLSVGDLDVVFDCFDNPCHPRSPKVTIRHDPQAIAFLSFARRVRSRFVFLWAKATVASFGRCPNPTFVWSIFFIVFSPFHPEGCPPLPPPCGRGGGIR